MELNKYDLQWCVRRLPSIIRSMLKKNEVVVAGGYIRASILNEQINDIDMFVHSKEYAKEIALDLVDNKEKRIIETDNAITLKRMKYNPQFITRWVYENPADILDSFDFTICQAMFWWDHYCQKWCSSCSDTFYQDLAAKRLVYTNPVREEEPGGSILRILKYYQKGYRIVLESYADVITRLVNGVRFSADGIFDEELGTGDFILNTQQFSKIIKGLMREVDPNIDPDHVIH